MCGSQVVVAASILSLIILVMIWLLGCVWAMMLSVRSGMRGVRRITGTCYSVRREEEEDDK